MNESIQKHVIVIIIIIVFKVIMRLQNIMFNECPAVANSFQYTRNKS